MEEFDLLFKLINENPKEPKTSFVEVESNSYKTYPFITLDALQSLLEDEEVFNKFIHFGENEEYFGDLTQRFIATAVNDYVEFMQEMGKKYDSKVLERIQKIRDFLPDNIKDDVDYSKQYVGISKEEIYILAISMLSSDEEFHTFLQCQQIRSPYKGISTEVIIDFLTHSFWDGVGDIALPDIVAANFGFLLNKVNLISKSPSYRVDPSIKINTEFEAKVIQGITNPRDPIQVAFDIYNGLNRIDEYDNNYAALDQNIEDPKAAELYYKGIEHITLENNKVTCKQWAEQYAYLLEKQGFEAYVCGLDGKHKIVIAFKGTSYIIADAVNNKYSEDKKSYLNDLTRCKLGMRPMGFESNDARATSNVLKVFEPADLTYDASKANDSSVINEVKELISLINEGDSRNFSQTIMGLGDPTSRLGSTIKKIALINQKLAGVKLDTMAIARYSHNLLDNFLVDGEEEYVEWSNIFFHGLGTNNCEMIPIICVGLLEVVDDYLSITDYLYFVLEPQQNAFKPINKEELKRRVLDGLYKTAEDEVREIPGFPELTDLDWVVRQQAANKLQKMQNEDIDKEGLPETRGDN